MNQHELELLTKAHQAAQMLVADLGEIFKTTTCVALEELMGTAIKDIVSLTRLLERLSKQS